MKFNKRHSLFFIAILKHSLVLLFSFFFLWGQASTISNTSDSGLESSKIISSHSVNHSHNPVGLPCEAPILPATEENESFDDDDWSNVYYHLQATYQFAFITSDVIVVYSDKVNHQTTERPLFMLYHCWKSFLI